MSQIGSKKSRRGCRRCKQRRVKCDERAPCNNCVRRNEQCSLLEPTPSGSSDASTEAGLQSRAEEWMQDLELMHHYSTSIALGHFGVGAKYLNLWGDYIPQQALKHAFLMHGLLALSALHLGYLHPEVQPRYLQLYDKHQSIALKAFREVLASPNISEDLADALFALSAVITVSYMARSCAMDDERVVEPASAAEKFILTRGVRDVIHIHYERIRSGRTCISVEVSSLATFWCLCPQLWQYEWIYANAKVAMVGIFENQEYPEEAEPTLPPSVSTRFEDVRQMLTTYGLDSEALTHCQEAWSLLEEVYKNIMYFGPKGDLEAGQVIRWEVQVPIGYVRLVQARNPPALIILAYYAATFTGIRRAWYTQNFAEYALRGVSLELDESMQRWIEWPQQQLQEFMGVLGVTRAQTEPQRPNQIIG